MGKVIAIASGKGGTGKTTIAAAVSSCLAVVGHKTLCIDFDTELRNLDLALCMTDFTVMDFMDVVSGRLDLMTSCSESPKIPNLFFLSAPTMCMPENIDRSAVKKMITEIRSNFDFCILDTPAGIGAGFRLAHTDVDMSIIITTGDLASMRDSKRAADAAREMGVENVRLLVNRVKRRSLKRIKTNIDDVIDSVGVQLIGIVPEDKNIFHALHENIPLVLYKKRYAAYDILDIAYRITGDDVPLQQARKIF